MPLTINIDDVPATESIFEYPDEDGNFHFPVGIFFRGVSGREVLTDRQILALAMTEFCSHIGRGKVILTLLSGDNS